MEFVLDAEQVHLLYFQHPKQLTYYLTSQNAVEFHNQHHFQRNKKNVSYHW